MKPNEWMQPDRCIGARLRRAVRIAESEYRGQGGPTALEPTQFTLLSALNEVGSCTLGELAAAVGIDPSTATRAVAIVERAGYARTAQVSEDRRRRRIEITSNGRRALGAALPEWRRGQEALVQRLGPVRFRQLVELLDALAEPPATAG